jgi:hypothetical protein
MPEPKLVCESERCAANDRGLAGGLQHGAAAQQSEISDAGRVRGRSRRATGVSPHAGRIHHPGVGSIELAGEPEC